MYYYYYIDISSIFFLNLYLISKYNIYSSLKWFNSITISIKLYRDYMYIDANSLVKVKKLRRLSHYIRLPSVTKIP